MKITKYSPKYQENVKDLLVQLQNYVISIDKYNLNNLGSPFDPSLPLIEPDYDKSKKDLDLLKRPYVLLKHWLWRMKDNAKTYIQYHRFGQKQLAIRMNRKV